jgi:crossover junction endodeoxyribonuclease RuvC
MPTFRNKQQVRPRILIGIDPGSNSVGYGVISKQQGKMRLLDAGLLAPPKRKHHYRAIASAMRKLILKWKPDAVGIEKLIFAKNVRTAMNVAEMTGVLKFVMEETGTVWREFSPPAVKMAVTGSGTAPKYIVGQMISAILGLSKKPQLHHASDAIAVALTLERSERFET